MTEIAGQLAIDLADQGKRRSVDALSDATRAAFERVLRGVGRQRAHLLERLAREAVECGDVCDVPGCATCDPNQDEGEA